MEEVPAPESLCKQMETQLNVNNKAKFKSSNQKLPLASN